MPVCWIGWDMWEQVSQFASQEILVNIFIRTAQTKEKGAPHELKMPNRRTGLHIVSCTD